MIFAIDIGNTHTVVGILENGEIRSIIRIHTDPRETDAELLFRLRQIADYRGLDLSLFEGGIISSAVPQLTGAMKTAVEALTGQRTLVVGPGVKTGINLRVDEPASVAADLIVCGVAAAACYGTPVIAVDMGTATTLVAVDRNNCFRGGAIIPGVKLSYDALSAGTSLLPAIAVQRPKKVVGSNTVDSMRSGAVYGTAAMLDGMVQRMEAELGCTCAVVATGGLAADIIPCCLRPGIIVDPELPLKGLWILYQKNR